MKINFPAALRSRIIKERVLLIALSVSVSLHALWFIMLGVNAPSEKGAKFASVSFFGPVFSRGIIEARSVPRERSFAEKRYFDILKGITVLTEKAGAVTELFPADMPAAEVEKRLKLITEKTMDADKAGPELF